MLFILVYFTLIFIAPQLWIPPFVGMRVDFFLYPAWLLWAVVAGRGPALLRLGPMDLFFAAFILWNVVSIAANPQHPRSTAILVDYAKWFVLFRLIVVSLPTLGHVRVAMKLLLFFALVLAAQGIDQMGDPDGAGWAGQGFAWMDELAQRAGVAGRTRWINIFDGPGVYCVVFTMTLPIALQYLWRPFGIVTAAWGAGLVGILLLATYYTGSRGGFLATIGVGGLFLLTKMRISVPRMAFVGVCALGVFLLAPDYLTSTRDSHGSAQKRVVMWGEGVEMVEQNPLFGIGRGNFARYTGRLIAHNSMVEIMGESGLPGLFTWLGLIYMAYKNIFFAWREAPDPVMRSYVSALGLAIAGYLLSSMFVTLEYETMYVLLAMAAAAGMALGVRPAFTRRDFFMLGGGILAMVFLLKVFVLVYPRLG